MTTTGAEAIARIIEAEIDHDIKGNIAWANGKRAATAILTYLASRREAEPVAWRYRSSINGKFGKWTVQKNRPHWFKPEMIGVELEPLYTAPPSPIPAPAGEVERLRGALNECRHWHAQQDKVLSKSGRGDAGYHWARSQHQEQMGEIDAALNGGQSS